MTKKQYIQFLLLLRKNINVKEITDNVEFYIQHYLYDYRQQNGDNYHLGLSKNFFINEEEAKIIPKDIEIGDEIRVLYVKMPYIDLINLYFENRLEYIDDKGIEVFYYLEEGNTIEYSILVSWSWEKYVGYSRKLHNLEFAKENSTEQDYNTGNLEKTNRINFSVLLTKDEIEGKSSEEINEMIISSLNDSSWKWSYFNTPNFETIIDEDLNL